ncbi:class I adenylate-forming enzyme family protein [Endothiovibrio diazotrophicus]
MTDREPLLPSLIHPGGRLDRRRLDREITRLAIALVHAGVRRGQLVAFPANLDPFSVILLHAAPRAGCALLPLDARMPAQRRAALLRGAGTEWFLGEHAPSLPSGVGFLSEEALREPSAVAETLLPEPLGAEEIRWVVATSGSGGEPRGVMLRGAELTAAAAAANRRLGLAGGDRWLACLPLFHIGGLAILLRCALAGATPILHPRFDPVRLLDEATRHGATHLSVVPAMLEQLLDAAEDASPPAPLRVVLVGGGPLSSGLARRALAAGWPLRLSYGLSEGASLIAGGCPLVDVDRPARVGPPLEGVELAVGADGALRIRGPQLMVGYANPGRRPGDGLEGGWLVTGDRGRLLADGSLEVLGRNDEVLVSGGENVQPEEVEAVLVEHPAVREVAVTAIPDPVWGQRLVALVVGGVEPAALEAWCQRRLAGPWRPRLFVRVSELPRTALGKLRRRELLALAAEIDQRPK